MTKLFFVTGTDTDVGKTAVSCGLLYKLKQQGLSVVGLKPVAAGCDFIDGEYKNTDALQLMAVAQTSLKYEEVNPVALKNPIAPHIAAVEESVSISAKSLVEHCINASKEFGVALIEGAGGWLVPLNANETFADVASGLKANIILVVGIRLGCINHTLLTIDSIRQRGLPLAGWVANCIDPEAERIEDNINALSERIDAPCLGIVSNLSNTSPEAVAEYLSVSPLLK